MATTEKDTHPYIAIDILTQETVGRYVSLFEGKYQNKGKPVEVFYRPRKKRAKGRTFP